MKKVADVLSRLPLALIVLVTLIAAAGVACSSSNSSSSATPTPTHITGSSPSGAFSSASASLSGSASASPSDSPSPTDSPGAVSANCPPVDVVNSLLAQFVGDVVSGPYPPGIRCTYHDQYGYGLEYVTIDFRPDTAAAFAHEVDVQVSSGIATAVSSLGDQAFSEGNLLAVFKGNMYFQIISEARTLDQLEALARYILANP